ncbi:MAG: ATP phosphoribosyltransferase, partial [Victivallales bacterium]|nr:ATP phosphoribosyltransferase [Victivallales bacterium]
HGIVDLGITGRDLLMDSQAEAVELLPLGFGKSRFTYAVPENSGITVEQLNGKRIASSYPNIVAADMKNRGYDCKVVKLDGAVEISIRLGVADAIADVVESGTTMRMLGLAPIGEPLMYSEAILIARDKKCRELPLVHTFLKRVQGILTARTYVMIEYDVPADRLEAVCQITPGLESPTVSPLSKSGWFAVKSMVTKKELNDAIDRLEELGANGIIVTDIKTCRI